MSEHQSPAEPVTEAHSRGALTEDLRELLRSIEAIHPDPYVGYESRVDLHARVERLIQTLPETMTTEAFYRLAAPVVAGLDDAHSLLHPPDEASPSGGRGDRRLPISLRVVGDALYVDAVLDGRLSELVGARLLGVEGTPVSKLVERSRSFRGAENRYGALHRTGRMIERYRPLARLLDADTPPDTTTVSFDVDGTEHARSLDPTNEEQSPEAELEPTVAFPTGPGPRYRLYAAGDVAVFTPGNLSDYRESLEAKHDAGGDAVADLAREAYDRQVGGSRPSDIDGIIAQLPSMTETLAALGDEMATAETETLIVDLRDNPGGDSQFVFHLAYLLGGRAGLADATEEIRVLRRRSEAYRRRYGTGGGDADGPDSDLENPAQYDFSGYFQPSGESGDAARVSLVRQRLSGSPTAMEFLERTDADGVYRPKQLIVVTSAGTMSSAFAGAAQLTGLGATVVGVPSGQAPVSFGEHVEHTLPHTGLDVRLSGSMFHWSDTEGDVLQPACELTPERFERYGSADAGLRLALEYAGHNAVADGR